MSNRRNAWLRIGAAASVALTLLLSACGSKNPSASASGESSGSGSGSGVSEASRIVSSLEGPVAWQLNDAPKVEVGSSLNGKLVYFIPNNLSLPFVQSVYKGVQNAATAVGMKVTAVDAAGQTAKAADAIKQAISQHASAIFIESITADVLSAPISEAKAAGIAVVEMYGRDPQLPDAQLKDMGVSAILSSCYACAGKEMAATVVADSKGKSVNAVVVTAPGVGVSQVESDAFAAELKRLCASCQTKAVGVPIPQWSTQLAATTTAQLQDPSVNYLIPVFDGAVPIMLPAISAAGADKRVKVVTFNASKPAMQELQKGGVVIVDVGAPEEWSGWAGMDQVIRALLKKPVLADEKVGDRVFDQKNISTVDLNADQSTWFSDVDYAAKYKALWGLS